MKPRFSWRILLGVLVCLTSLWTSPAAGRLYPPIRDISYSVENSGTTLRYWTTNLVWSNGEETWFLPQSDERYIKSVTTDQQGLLAWIYQYKNNSDPFYTYYVIYRIYDPAAGNWKGGYWGPFAGYNGTLEQLSVKDGVITWITHQSLGPGATDTLEHQVVFATYDPALGNFVWGYYSWQVPSTSKYAPEVLRIKNGVVAWPMRDAVTGQSSDMTALDIYCVIYDYGINQWKGVKDHWTGGQGSGGYFDWINIPNDTVMVDLQSGYSDGWNQHSYIFYDPDTHTWGVTGDYNAAVRRRAFFVAAPNMGLVPFTTCFWDCSFALDGVNTASAWSWDMDGSDFSTDRSPVLPLPFLITFPGPFDRTDTVTEHVTYNDTGTLYTATGQVEEKTPPPPTGNISINNGAAYTNSANVTLSLNYDASATQMRFRQVPGEFLYSPWEPVAPSKAWTLSTVYELGSSPDGPHTVYVKFRDQYQIESQEYAYTITLVTTPPAALLLLDWGAAGTTNRNVQVFCIASSAYPMDISWLYFEEINGWGWSSWSIPVPYPSLFPLYTVIPFTASSSQKPVMVVMVQFKDIAGNISQVQASIALKPPPLGHLLPLLLD